MNIVVNPDLQAYIDPLTPEENEALERSLLAEGCRDALVLWGEMLVDGHNRYRLCQLHGLPFRTVQHPSFRSIEDVHLWMIDQHLGRRSLSNYQRGVLALRKSEILADRRAVAGVAAARAATAAATSDAAPPAADAPPPVPAERLSGRDAIAKAARLSPSQVQMIEKIHKQAAPEVVAAVRAGSLSISAAAAVAALPAEEQTAAAAAGADELKSAARRAREGKRKPREAAPATATPAVDPVVPAGAIDSTRPPWEAEAAGAGDAATLAALRQQVAELTLENEALRQELAVLRAAAQA